MRSTQKKLRGFILWEGPSELDGKPVVVIATRGAKGGPNRKTGSLIQTYILRSDVSPTDAVKSGADISVCGDCKHRRVGGLGTCYVRVENGPLIVWKAYQAGRYPRISLQQVSEELSGELVRLGAYGDPAAVPYEVWRSALSGVRGVTGYTHAWNHPSMQHLRTWCMASVDSEGEFYTARAMGWRTFYVVPTDYQSKPKSTFLCPASEQAGKLLTCSECMACDGDFSGRTASVVIPVHGVAYKQQRFNNLIQIGGKHHA